MTAQHGVVRVVHRTPTRCALSVTGAVDRAAIEVLRGACRPERVPEGATVVIDFTAMTDCPSALLPALLRINHDLGTTRRLQLDGLGDALVAIASGGARTPPAVVA